MVTLEDAVKDMDIDPSDLLVIMDHIKKEGDTLKGIEAYIREINATVAEFKAQLSNSGFSVKEITADAI